MLLSHTRGVLYDLWMSIPRAVIRLDPAKEFNHTARALSQDLKRVPITSRHNTEARSDIFERE
jgi:hypothetical protein